VLQPDSGAGCAAATLGMEPDSRDAHQQSVIAVVAHDSQAPKTMQSDSGVVSVCNRQ
jgi:hypothetical protein